MRCVIATFVRTKAGTWKAVIRKNGWPTVSKTFRVKRDAENWARTIEDEIVRGIFIPRGTSEKLTVAAALDRYTKEVTPTQKTDIQRRELGRAQLLKQHFGPYSLAALNTELIATFRDNRLAEGKANNTVRPELALLSHLFATAIKEWGIGLAINPVLNIRKPSSGPGRNRRLVGDEEKRLLKQCDAHSNLFLGWIVRLALYTAMRKGEITSLTRNQIDLKKRTIVLTNTKNADIRTVPLTNKAHQIIKQALDYPIRPIDTDLLFYGEPGKDGTRKPYKMNRVWSKALSLAGIDNFLFHDLRHEATSRFVEAGLSDQEVSSITGQRSMQMLKRYTHLRNQDLVSRINHL